MTPPEPPPSSPQDHLSAETLHDLRTPLTVIGAQSQLVARWLRRLDHPEGAPVLARLAMVDALIHQVSEQLQTLSEADEDDPGDRHARNP